MKQLQFYKYQGIGNDFIICDKNDVPDSIDLSALAIKLCNRHYGIGADGLILRTDGIETKHRMQIINSDGSEPEMCGNGLRTFVRYLSEVKSYQVEEYEIETLAGLMLCTMTSEQWVRVNMGTPILEQELIPATGFSSSPIISESLEVNNQQFVVTVVSMGNPHCVIFVDDISSIELTNIGPLIEKHPSFPRHTNVEFVQILASNRAKMVVWERGAGVTMACGTGACAVLVAGCLNQFLERQALIELPGGNLEIDWDVQSQNVLMSGPAQFVYQGSVGI